MKEWGAGIFHTGRERDDIISNSEQKGFKKLKIGGTQRRAGRKNMG